MARSEVEQRLWNCFRQMRQASTNPNNRMYQSYQRAGITLNCEWERYRDFVDDIMTYLGPPPTPKSRLVRKNMHKDFVLKNLEWTTHQTQQRRQRSCHLIKYRGRTQTLVEWSEQLGIALETIHYRISHGYTKPSDILYKGKLYGKT